jgi:hypothetical protein
MKLIDKDALVAEIEKGYNKCLKRAKITDSDYWNVKADVYRNVLVILNDTLEVKEVDLEEEIVKWEESFKYCPASMGYKETAKHFFELGLKARKG